MGKNTNLCKWCANVTWANGETPNTWNLYCREGKKTIACNITTQSNVECPFWCPKGCCDSKKEQREHPFIVNSTKTETLPKVYTYWSGVEPKVKWEEIKVGDIYHIPPYGYSATRQDIEILSVDKMFLTYKVLNPKDSYDSGVKYMYDSYTMYKVMVKKMA